MPADSDCDFVEFDSETKTVSIIAVFMCFFCGNKVLLSSFCACIMN